MVLKILRNLFLIRNEKTGKEKWIDEGVWAEYEPEVWSKVETLTMREISPFISTNKLRNGGAKHISGPVNHAHISDRKVFCENLYRREWMTRNGKETTDIKFEAKEDGSIVIDGCDMGPSVEEWFGDWDHEYSLKIERDDIPKFLYLVLREAFHSSKPLTYGALRKMCKANRVEVNSFSWS